MRRGFTLIELLVVIGIMGLLGTISVGGYRAMQRGMEERGVMGNVNTFVRAAYQRAQIDRQPTALIFWNETLREETDDEPAIVVGKAVAVRRHGRLTRVDNTNLFDEFADLDLTYQTDQQASGSAQSANTMYLYPMDSLSDIESSGNIKRSVVAGMVYQRKVTPVYASSDNGDLADESSNGEISLYSFKVEDQGGVSWQPGMAYGFEFAHLELPHGYVFGSDYSDKVSDPVREAGTIVFDVGANYGSGMSGSAGLRSRYQIMVSALRPNDSGAIKPQTVGTSEDPTKELN